MKRNFNEDILIRLIGNALYAALPGFLPRVISYYKQGWICEDCNIGFDLCECEKCDNCRYNRCLCYLNVINGINYCDSYEILDSIRIETLKFIKEIPDQIEDRLIIHLNKMFDEPEHYFGSFHTSRLFNRELLFEDIKIIKNYK